MSNEPKRSEDSPPNLRQNRGQITPFESIRRTNTAGNEKNGSVPHIPTSNDNAAATNS
jgi:hypothetical protein